MTTNKRITSIAYYEAARFVAKYKSDPSSLPYSVNCYPSGCGEVTDGHPLRDGADEKDLEIALVGLYCGYAAQIEFEPVAANEKSYKANAASADEQADRFMTWFRKSAKEKEHLKEEIRNRAKALVRDNWAAISALAKDLLQYETLGGDEAELIVKRAEGVEGAKESLARYRKFLKRGYSLCYLPRRSRGRRD